MNLEGSLVKKSREKALVGTYILQQILQVFWRVFCGRQTQYLHVSTFRAFYQVAT